MSVFKAVPPRRLVLAAFAGLFAATSCDDVTGPREAGTGAYADPWLSGAFAPSIVSIETTEASTTGVPVLPLPLAASGAAFSNPTLSAINESNWVAGTGSQGGRRAVLWRGGAEFELIPRPSAVAAEMTGLGLNDEGMVVGIWDGISDVGFRWSDATGSVLLPNPPSLSSGGDARAHDVDDDGNIIVFYWRNTQQPCSSGGSITDGTAVLRPPWSTGDYEVIPHPLCNTTVSGAAIDAGSVVGRVTTLGTVPTEAFHWDGTGDVQLIGDWFPRDIAGAFIAGQQFVGGVGTAGRAVHPGGFDPIGTLPGGSSSDGRGANGLGWVVGSANTDVNGALETHAFLWTPGDGMIDLGTLGGNFSRAVDVNDQGYIVGEARNAANQLVPVIWFVDPAGPDQRPEIEPILSQSVTVGETLVVTPVASDPEGDSFTLSWSGVPDGATTNGSFTWTPTAADVGDAYEVTVTATQDDTPALFDSETFAVSVLAEPVPSANLSVLVGPVTPQQQFVADVVAYQASVHNAGPDAVMARLEVALQYREQAGWGTVPPAAAVNGIFFVELEVAAGETENVPFEVVYGAFGVQTVTATVSGDHDEIDPADDAHVFDQVVDLAFGTTGVETGGLDVPGTHTTDGLGLAVVGVRIPSALIAGDPGLDLFLPADLTPGGLLDGGQSVMGASFEPGAQFEPAPGTFVPAALAATPGEVGSVVILESAHWLDGRILIPAVNAWDPTGRLLFERGNTTLRVNDRASTTLSLERGGGPGLKVNTAGGSSDARLGFCADAFQAHLGDGDDAEFACGSLTTTVLTGEVSIMLADGTRVDVAADASVEITEDGEGGFAIRILAGSEDDVTVTPPAVNRAPEAVPGGPYVVAAGQPLTLDGTGSADPDGDPLTYDWRLEDGSPDGIATAGATPTIAAPTVPGLYLLTLTVSDSEGASSTAFTEVAVYDPDGSSVAGGGWFDSPAGALPADPWATGRATFAFHVEYRRGRSTPDGHARLAFNAGGLHLSSESFDWLVVAGQMARFRGMGVLDGRAGTVSFEVVARAPDRIQVRIWDAGGTLYHSTEVQIGGGRIVIQG